MRRVNAEEKLFPGRGLEGGGGFAESEEENGEEAGTDEGDDKGDDGPGGEVDAAAPEVDDEGGEEEDDTEGEGTHRCS